MEDSRADTPASYKADGCEAGSSVAHQERISQQACRLQDRLSSDHAQMHWRRLMMRLGLWRHNTLIFKQLEALHR